MKDDDFTWGDILKEFDEEYHYFHDNSPKFIQKLNKKQINRFGELDCRVYDNPIISSLHLTEGKYLVNEAEYATYPARTSINYICKSLNIPNNVVFYLDPNLKGGIYTMDNIAPNTIVNSEFC